ncbi:MAG: hypothetical protein IPP49_18900 [Saprospiraceae bacterium]|nr:hypothetical protein [Saprospiraceae bacterium]
MVVHSDLFVAPGKYIKVRQGGSLKISNGGHITSCSGMWNGVDVFRGTVTMEYGGSPTKLSVVLIYPQETWFVTMRVFENINGVVLIDLDALHRLIRRDFLA